MKTMKKFINWSMMMLVVMMLLPLNAYCQEAKNNGKPFPVFCRVRFEPVASGFKVKILNDKELARTICDEKNEPICFETPVGGLNYVSSLGWVYLDHVTLGNDIYYQFKKEAVSADEAYKSLNALTSDEIKKAKKGK